MVRTQRPAPRCTCMPAGRRKAPARSRRKTYGEALPNGFTFLSGDVNYKDYGGKWIKRTGGREYTVIELTNTEDAGGASYARAIGAKYLIQVYQIDLDDVSPRDMQGALSTSGWENEPNLSDEMLVEAVLSYQADAIDSFPTNNYRDGLMQATRWG